MAQQLTQDGARSIDSISQRYGISRDAVETMLVAVNIGGGSMAQFSIPELGGSGQWMRGGMTMVGNMFDHGLKQRVDNLCNDLSNLLASTQVFAPLPQGQRQNASNNWWPTELGNPSSSGGQNDARYAIFPHVKRLAVQAGGRVTVYDTMNHSIGGVSQQQGSGAQSLLFSSQYGQFGVTTLPQVNTDDNGQAAPTVQASESQTPASAPPSVQPPQQRNDPPQQWSQQPEQRPSTLPPDFGQQSGQQGDQQSDIFASIEALAGLHARGILTDDEFSTKKAELLSRL